MCRVCGRDPIHGKFNFWDSNYCSYYCQVFDERNLTMVKLSDSVHHNDHPLIYPRIIVPCETCGGDTTIRWSEMRSNKAFCNQKCNNIKIKKSIKHYFPLKVLKHAKTPLLAGDISKICDGQQIHIFTSTSVANILRQYTSKGIVERVWGGDFSPSLKTYLYVMSESSKSKPVKSFLL